MSVKLMLNETHIPEKAGSIPVEPDWDVQVFYDGQCPLCRREIAALHRLDRRRRIQFTDIAADEFSAADHGKKMEELMDQIHGRLPDGTWVVGVEVFRRLYAAIGLSSLVAMSRLPVVSHLLDWGYRHFAKNRLKWTGRCQAESDACRVT